MQHITALLRGKSYSTYAINLIVSTLKKIFLLIIFQVTKTVELTLKNTTSEIYLIFYLTSWRNFEIPYPSYAVSKVTSTQKLTANIGAANLLWDPYFANRIFMLRHAEALPKPRRIDIHIILDIYRTFCCILPHGIACPYLYIPLMRWQNINTGWNRLMLQCYTT